LRHQAAKAKTDVHSFPNISQIYDSNPGDGSIAREIFQTPNSKSLWRATVLRNNRTHNVLIAQCYLF
jgi:hypothetical protein